MKNEDAIQRLTEKYTETFCPGDVPPSGGMQLDTGNSYPNAENIDIAMHITGKKTFALNLAYTDSKGQEVCKIGVVDIDQLDDEGLATAIEIRDYLRDRGITVLLAFSGKKGYHVCLISEPIPKKVMCVILKKIKAKFTFTGELIPGDGRRCKIGPCLHQVAGQWSYFFEESPAEVPFDISNLPDDFYKQQLEILNTATPTPGNVIVALAMESPELGKQHQSSDAMIPHLDQLEGGVTPCIDKLIHNGGSSSIGTYDKNNLCLATFCHSAHKDHKVAIKMATTMAEKSIDGPVTSSKTKVQKVRHFNSTKDTPSVTEKPFSCKYLLGAKKELQFECDNCPARPEGLKISEAKDANPQLLEFPLANSLIAHIIQNGMPKEHISPRIMPIEDYKTHYRDREGVRIVVKYHARTVIMTAMAEGVTSSSGMANWLDNGSFSKNLFTEFCSDVVPSIHRKWKEPDRDGIKIKTLNELSDLTVKEFAFLQNGQCVDDCEYQTILERAVMLTQKYEISEQLNDYKNAIYSHEKDIYTLNAEFTHNTGNILEDSQKNAVVPLCNHALQLIESISGNRKNTIPTPFNTLNTLLGGGFQACKLYVEVAQPGGGKTTFAAQCADYAAESGIPVIFVSMEMGREQLFAYSLSRQGEINSAKIETIHAEVREKIEPHLVAVIECYFETIARNLCCIEGKYNTSPATIEVAISIVRSQMGLEKKDPVLVVIDYLQLLSTGNEALDYGQNETAKISELAVKVKQLARDNNVAVLAISDVTKKEQEGSWSNKELSLNSPRGSNRIAHAADCLMALYSEPAHSQGGKADSDPWDVFIEKFKDDSTAREFIERLTEKKESTELGGDGATVFSRLEIIKNRGGQGRGNQIMLYHRAYHKFEPVEIEGHDRAERRA